MKIFAYKTPLLCNQRCFFCVTNAQYKNKQYNIPIKKVIKDLLVLKKQWYTHISIEWGEPTLVDNLNDLIRIWKKLNFWVSIITNGYNCSYDKLVQLYESWLKNITFSIHSDEEEIHDRLVWKQWSFEKLQWAIKYAIHIWFKVSTNTVICKQNQESIARIVNQINTQFPWIVEVSFCNIEVNYTHKMDYEKKRFMFTNLDKIKKSIHKIKYDNVSIDNLPLCIFGEDTIKYAVLDRRDEQNKLDFEKWKIEKINFKLKWEICKQCTMTKYCKWVFPYFDGEKIKPFTTDIISKSHLLNKYG
jgi:MoaA/NifB/PqqE/SkfB family radical SAM enzyme